MIGRHIATAIRVLGPALGALTEATLLFTGVGLVSYGAWEAYRPAGPIVGGALLIAGILLRARGSQGRGG